MKNATPEALRRMADQVEDIRWNVVPSDAAGLLRAAADRIELLEMNAHDPTKDWYVTNEARNHERMRGPFVCAKAAGAVRAEMESKMSDAQAERVNLWVKSFDAGK